MLCAVICSGACNCVDKSEGCSLVVAILSTLRAIPLLVARHAAFESCVHDAASGGSFLASRKLFGHSTNWCVEELHFNNNGAGGAWIGGTRGQAEAVVKDSSSGVNHQQQNRSPAENCWTVGRLHLRGSKSIKVKPQSASKLRTHTGLNWPSNF